MKEIKERQTTMSEKKRKTVENPTKKERRKRDNAIMKKAISATIVAVAADSIEKIDIQHVEKVPVEKDTIEEDSIDELSEKENVKEEKVNDIENEKSDDAHDGEDEEEEEEDDDELIDDAEYQRIATSLPTVDELRVIPPFKMFGGMPKKYSIKKTLVYFVFENTLTGYLWFATHWDAESKSFFGYVLMFEREWGPFAIKLRGATVRCPSIERKLPLPLCMVLRELHREEKEEAK